MDVIRVKGKTGISLFRGDTKDVTLSVKKDGELFLPDEMKGMRVTLTARDDEKRIVLQQETFFDDSIITIHFSHEQTQNLAPGRYDYDVELRNDDGSQLITLFRDYLRVIPDITYEG